jgi:VRR-NUC domain
MSAPRHRPSAPAPDRNGEARIQAAIVEWVRTIAPDVLIFAVPNGGLRSKAEAARLKWTGVVAGVPDLAVIAPTGKAHFLEVKTPTGRLSDDQREIITALGRLGSPFMTVTSIDDVRRAFSCWGIQTRESAR